MEDEEANLAEEDIMMHTTIQTETELADKRKQTVEESQKLVLALEELKANAAQKLEQAAKIRDGSRTPRRRSGATGTEHAKETAKDTKDAIGTQPVAGDGLAPVPSGPSVPG